MSEGGSYTVLPNGERLKVEGPGMTALEMAKGQAVRDELQRLAEAGTIKISGDQADETPAAAADAPAVTEADISAARSAAVADLHRDLGLAKAPEKKAAENDVTTRTDGTNLVSEGGKSGRRSSTGNAGE